MIARLRAAWIGVNSSYWFYPAVFSIIAAILAFVTVHLDRNGAAELIMAHEWLSPARPEGASNILQVIAGSMIGVASTVFSITIAAVAYASGNYGPRLLTNFMEDKGNQLSLGTFIATFVYAVMVLRVVRGEDEQPSTAQDAIATALPGFVPQLSLLTACLLMALSVAVLVFFLNHIPSSIRIHAVLQGIGERLIRQIRERFPEDAKGDDPERAREGHDILSRRIGYIQIIDFAGLQDLAQERDITVQLRQRTGDFVHPGIPLVNVSGDEPDEELQRCFDQCFSLGGMRSPQQDPEFLIDELVEIALRALSPGINDPFTAVTAIHWLGAATAELAARDLRHGPEADDYDAARVQPLDDDFEHFLRRGFGCARSAVATNPIAAAKCLDTLQSVGARCMSDDRRRLLVDEIDQLMRQAETALTGPSIEEVRAQYAQTRGAVLAA
jgi:uncharacterized membrane protein